MNVTATSETDHVVLYAADGRVVYRRKLSIVGDTTLLLNDLPDLKGGVYLLQASINGKLYTLKLIKE